MAFSVTLSAGKPDLIAAPKWTLEVLQGLTESIFIVPEVIVFKKKCANSGRRIPQ